MKKGQRQKDERVKKNEDGNHIRSCLIYTNALWFELFNPKLLQGWPSFLLSGRPQLFPS